MGTPDPFEAMTIREAARCVGVSVGEVRARIDSGDILHERARRGGREVLLVRRMDLAGCWPAALSGDPNLVADNEGGFEPQLPGAPAAGPSGGAHSGDDGGPGGTQGKVRHHHGGAEPSHALEVRLASLQVSNSALQSKVLDLEGQRQDLKEQRLELSGRMALIEQERQASTAALLRVQGRVMELEVSRPEGSSAVWWRRQTTWGLAGCVFLLVGSWSWQGSVVRAAQDESVRLSGVLQGELDAQDVERASWVRASAEVAAEVDAERRTRDVDRQVILDALSRRAKQLEDERAAADNDRQQFEDRVNGLISDGAASRALAMEEQAARESLLSADRDAAFEVLSRERAAIELERRRFEVVLAEQAATALLTQDALLAQVQDARQEASELEQRITSREAEGLARAELMDAALARVMALEERLRLVEARGLLSRALSSLWK